MTAADTNHVVLIGRLTKDMDLRYTTTQKAVGKFFLAVNKKRKSGDQWKVDTGFFEIILWGKFAEQLKQYLIKGKQIAVEGELTQERWEQNGQSRSKVVVTASSIQLLSGSGGSGAGPKQETTFTDESYIGDDIPF